jgi:TIR domain
MAGNDTCPVYFTSYRRDDRDKYLEVFLDALARSVASEAGIEVTAVRFEDLASLAPGDIWTDEAVAALRRAHVLVALYSPRYFKRRASGPCNTGREVAAFLERARLGDRRPCILPILWTTRRSLDKAKMPPSVLKSVHYDLPNGRPLSEEKREAFGEYNQLGMLQMLKESVGVDGKIHMVIGGLVHRIMEMDEAPPPELAEFDFHDGVCAFHSGADSCSADIPRVSSDAVSRQLGPNELLLIDFEQAKGAESEGADQTLFGLAAKKAADVGLNPTPLRWADEQATDELLDTLETAWSRNQMILLTGSRERLRDGPAGPAVEAALEPARDWVVGVAVSGDARLVTEQNDRSIVVNVPEDDSSGREIKRLITNLRQKMARFGQAPPPDDRPGPTDLPRL